VTESDAADYLQEAIAAALREGGGQFADACIGIECALKDLADRGFAIEELVFAFAPGGMTVEHVRFLPQVPADYQLEAFWAVLYTLCYPKQSPFGGEAWRPARAAVGYRRDPQIGYHHGHDVGLPLGCDRAYEAAKAGKSPAA